MLIVGAEASLEGLIAAFKRTVNLWYSRRVNHILHSVLLTDLRHLIGVHRTVGNDGVAARVCTALYKGQLIIGVLTLL